MASLRNGLRRAPRVLFYSHDTMGLGHMRRTLLLSEGLSKRFADLSILIVTGSSMAHAFRLSPGLDYIKLPSVRKIENECYQSRALNIRFDELLCLRRRIILETVRQYRPDVFVVDNVPRGLQGELLDTLEHLRRHSPETRIILVLRDILDDRSQIVPFWQQAGVFQLLEDFYDRILILGSSRVFDPIVEYSLPGSVSSKTRFCGYIPRPFDRLGAVNLRHQLCPDGEKLVLVTVGGGSDGRQLIEAYLQALPVILQEIAVVSLVLLGPDMDCSHAKRIVSSFPNTDAVRFYDFCDDSVTWMSAADLIVSMAGYNTVSEILWLQKQAIVLPRVFPRSEQLIRARRFEAEGLLQMIHPNLLTPEGLAGKVLASLHLPVQRPATQLPFTAIERMSAELQDLFEQGLPLGTSPEKGELTL